jgi:hypothetical protein
VSTVRHLGLTDTANNNLLQILQGNTAGPAANDAIKAALQGKPLTPDQIKAIQNTINNDANLTQAQIASLYSVLQTDKDRKRQNALIAALKKSNGGTGVLVGGADGSAAAGSDGGTLVASGTDGVPVTGGDGGDAQQGELPANGLKITEVLEGPARQYGLKEGDIILTLGGTATQTVDELKAALAGVGPEAEVVFINVDNGQTESMVLRSTNGRLGVMCVPVPVS